MDGCFGCDGWWMDDDGRFDNMAGFSWRFCPTLISPIDLEFELGLGHGEVCLEF